MKSLTCFKAYDIRGRLGDELNEAIAYRLGRAYAQHFEPRKVVVGADVRQSSPALKKALANGLMDCGVDVIDLGMTGTEEIYFATFFLEKEGVDGGIEVTASHNPIDYNGMKLVTKGARPISGDSGLKAIQKLVEENSFPARSKNRGKLRFLNLRGDYTDHILGYVNLAKLEPLKVVVNSGNGAAGPVIDALERVFNARQIPIQFIKIQHTPDSKFPNGIPNPLLPENRADTTKAVIKHGADMGIAWDGDFDRCFMFNEQGEFIEGYYIVGLLAEAFLQKEPGAKIIHDPRLTWNTLDIVRQNGGIAVQSKTGHAFIKERMRQENAIYGGEMSAHHYFRDFAYCDSGMIPWLLVTELLCKKNKPLSELVKAQQERYPSPGELNFQVVNPEKMIQLVENYYQNDVLSIDRTDGLSMEFKRWRFNLRVSNTEALVRLNLETRGDPSLIETKKKELSQLLCQTNP
ncbi:phosphomannomutase CpsG [Idiomarina seosinensis]|uniref:phosphomannomutase CpsG n=1 Tax=Idiomarina seosinensis TaxID=281739 RepID=UPI00384A6FF0